MHMQLKSAIENTQGPIVEIGGPTLEGYQFVKLLGCKLSSDPIISNISKRVTLNPFGENPQEYTVDEVVDVKNMPFENESIGMIITCSLPYSDSDLFKEFSSPDKRQSYLKKNREKALYEYVDYDKSDNLESRHNLHIALIEGAAKALKTQGILIMEEALVEDLMVAESNNFSLLYSSNNPSLFIFQKS